MKSFAELHTLWYLCLRERNTFATVKEERKRWNIHKRMTQMDVGRADKAVRRCAVLRASSHPQISRALPLDGVHCGAHANCRPERPWHESSTSCKNVGSV